MAHFVAVPAEAIEQPLRALGFQKVDDPYQIVYVKHHDACEHILVKVYTSIPPYGDTVRRAGKDSIRVAVVYRSLRRSFGIGKFPYIARITSPEFVVNKMLNTVKAAWERGQQWYNEDSVKHVMHE